MTQRKPLSPRTKRVYHFIRLYKLAHGGMAPSLRQICENCGIVSTNTVHIHLDKLVEYGLIMARTNEQSRDIRLEGEKYTPPPSPLGVWSHA